jgi:coenzyme PQQ synthesis protein D (PqqD)
MLHPDASAPKSRQVGLVIEQVGDETIVYDHKTKQAHSLNRTASIVWRNCDGHHSISQLADIVRADTGVDADVSIVHYALDRLSSAQLLEDDASEKADGVTRRDVLRRMAAAGVATIAIPAVLSIAAPTPAMAASGSGGQNNQGQNKNTQGQNQNP